MASFVVTAVIVTADMLLSMISLKKSLIPSHLEPSGCGVDVESLGTHGLSCHYTSDSHCRHAAVNDIVKRSLDSARIPCHFEPSSLYRSDGRRPDGATIVQWKYGKVLFSVGCNIPRHFCPILCFNSISRSRSSGQGGRTPKGDEVFPS